MCVIVVNIFLQHQYDIMCLYTIYEMPGRKEENQRERGPWGAYGFWFLDQRPMKDGPLRIEG